MPAEAPPAPPEPTSTDADTVDAHRRFLLALERAVESAPPADRAALADAAAPGIARVDALMEMLKAEIRRAAETRDAGAVRAAAASRTSLHALRRRVAARLPAPEVGAGRVARRSRPRGAAALPVASRNLPLAILALSLAGALAFVAIGLGGRRAPPAPAPRKNAPPEVVDLRLDFDGGNLRAIARVRDPEGGPLATLHQWTIDGRPAGGNFSFLPAFDVPPGAVVEVQVWVFDAGGARSRVRAARWTKAP